VNFRLELRAQGLATATLPHVALFVCLYFPQAVGQGVIRVIM
jgi:hypothetical protein